MSQQENEKAESLRELLRQHWQHSRHIESERAWFMSVYAAITGGMFAFIAYTGAQNWWPLYFIIVLTFVGFVLTIRWTYAFECLREKVNKLASIVWLESSVKELLDPTMDIPAMHIFPQGICVKKVLGFLPRIVNELFRIRYWFALFYFFVLIGLVVALFLVADSPLWGRGLATAALVIAFFLGIGWYSSLKQIGKGRKVILEGCNGEWAQERYLPLLAGEAAKGNIELWAVDIEPQIKLSTPSVATQWRIAQSKGNACYLDKTRDKEAYEVVFNANYVFIVTPDRSHCQIAEFWLERLAPKGRIFIEKPLDASVGSGLKLKEKIEETGEETVFAFDHFLADAYPFLQNKVSYLGEIGEIRKIECNILEPDKIPPEREKTLDKGMIFDLFCHVLALVGAVVKQNSSYSEARFQGIKLDVKAARYVGCPISGETFSLIKFMVNNDVEVTSAVGKCVGTFEDKFMELHGANGKVKLDFIRDEFAIFDAQDKLLKKEKLLADYVETYLGKLLPGKKQPLSLPGVLSFDAAFEILTILDEAKRQVDKMPEYQCNESIGEILERF